MVLKPYFFNSTLVEITRTSIFNLINLLYFSYKQFALTSNSRY